MEFWILGGDERNRWAAEYLCGIGHEVHTFGVPGCSDEPMPLYMERTVLPFPSFQGALLRGVSAIPIEEILHRVDGDSTIFGGLIGTWAQAFTHRKAQVFDLYSSEPLTTANAVPTAEGAICLAKEHSPITLHGASCLVLGYGRVGKILAAKLQALSAHVTVALRKAADQALAEALGLATDQICVYSRGLTQYDFVFNTVPAEVLTGEQLACLRKDCVLLELASAPGGFSRTQCEALGLTCCHAPGLPGKFAPKTAGILYAQSILTLLQKEDSL